MSKLVGKIAPTTITFPGSDEVLVEEGAEVTAEHRDPAGGAGWASN